MGIGIDVGVGVCVCVYVGIGIGIGVAQQEHADACRELLLKRHKISYSREEEESW